MCSEPVITNKLKYIVFDVHDIQDVIRTISATSAAGPDSFPSIFLKKSAETLSGQLYKLWRECFIEEITPQMMKQSHITLIHTGKAENYRPVSLTSLLVKVFEKVIRKYIHS